MAGFILSIETSCDNTCLAVINCSGVILLNYNINQDYLLSKFGGYVPNLLSDNHVIAFKKIFSNFDFEILKYVDIIAVTLGPGLIFSLAIGFRLAYFISTYLNIPLFCVDHIEAHMISPLIENLNIKYPFTSLVISGGHCLLANVKNIGEYEFISTTNDDSPGEVFDKVARVINLEIPCGSEIEKIAYEGKIIKDLITFKSNNKNYKLFSFSGVKSKFIKYIRSGVLYKKCDIAISLQEAILITMRKTINYHFKHKIDTLAISGGVACNNYIFNKISDCSINCCRPSNFICTDNAVMIAFCCLAYKNTWYNNFDKKMIFTSALCRDVYPYDRFFWGV